MPRRLTSQRALAQHLGVSVMTVNRALQDHPDVNAETRLQIQELARKNGYKLKQTPGRKKRPKTKTVALVLRENQLHLPVKLIQGIYRGLQRYNHGMIIEEMPGEKMGDSEAIIQHLSALPVDGLLIDFQPYNFDTAFAQLNTISTPHVWVNNRGPMHGVHPNDYQASVDLTTWLLRHGRSKIAYLEFRHGGDRSMVHFSQTDRLLGYEETMIRHQLTPRSFQFSYSLGGSNDQRIDQVATILTQDNPPDAVICYTVRALHPLLMATQKLGLDVPGDLQPAVFHEEVQHDYGVPVITSEIPFKQIGEQAAQRIIDLIGSKKDLDPIEAIPGTIHVPDSLT